MKPASSGVDSHTLEKISRLETQNQTLLDELHKLGAHIEVEKIKSKREIEKLNSEKSDQDFFKDLETDQRSAKMAERLKAKIAQVGELNEEITLLKIDNAKLKMDYDNLQLIVKKKYQVVSELFDKIDIDKASTNADKYNVSFKYLAD